MRKLLFAFVAVALLCAARAGVDDFHFQRKEFVRADFPLRVVEHQSLDELRSAAPGRARYGVAPGSDIFAWSIVRADGGCEIHIVDPAVKYLPEWIGHELMHCTHGRWHD